MPGIHVFLPVNRKKDVDGRNNPEGSVDMGPAEVTRAADNEAAPQPVAPFVAVIDEEQVRAAVTVALDASMEAMAGEITRRVLAAILATRKPEGPAVVMPAPAIALVPSPSKPAEPAPPEPRVEPVRRVSPLRMRSNSILGLEIDKQHPE